jgi:histone-arginine methyltransferase CARM1
MVYAVDASDSCAIARKLSETNGFTSKMNIIQGKIELIDLPEKVDVIVSEPIGFLLVHERMIESYICARNRFLKPGGKMFPSSGTIYLSPFSDESLYQEQLNKIRFWEVKDFYGIDLSGLVEQAYVEFFRQPVVG